MSKEEITKHKSETHEVAVVLSRAYPELAVALSPFGYAQGKLRRRGSRMGRMGEFLFLNLAFGKFIIVIRKARTRFTYKLFLNYVLLKLIFEPFIRRQLPVFLRLPRPPAFL